MALIPSAAPMVSVCVSTTLVVGIVAWGFVFWGVHTRSWGDNGELLWGAPASVTPKRLLPAKFIT